jgi:hypothetical protein
VAVDAGILAKTIQEDHTGFEGLGCSTYQVVPGPDLGVREMLRLCALEVVQTTYSGPLWTVLTMKIREVLQAGVSNRSMTVMIVSVHEILAVRYFSSRDVWHVDSHRRREIGGSDVHRSVPQERQPNRHLVGPH